MGKGKTIKKGEVRITYHGRKEKNYQLNYDVVLPVELAAKLIEITLKIADSLPPNQKEEK